MALKPYPAPVDGLVVTHDDGVLRLRLDRPKRRNATINCMLSILISPERLGTAGTLSPEIDTFVGWVRSGNNADVLLPGDVEAGTTAERRAHGIPIDAKSWSDIVAAGREVGAEPPSSLRELAASAQARSA